MFYLVDSRNRAQLAYSFRNKKDAQKYLRKIKNNPFGITVFYLDGRREYFENGIPKNFFKDCQKVISVKKGCHVRYQISESKIIDGLLKKNPSAFELGNLKKWKSVSGFELFALGNYKLYFSMAIISCLLFLSAAAMQKYFGNSVSAQSGRQEVVLGSFEEKASDADLNADSSEQTDSKENQIGLDPDSLIASLIEKIEIENQQEFKNEILRYIKGSPMEKMAPYIAKQDRIVAAFIVGIAMKESKFGVYSPKKNGRDCYNYWGYRGPENTTDSGYSCFSSPEHAVSVIGSKISKLVARGINSPQEMVLWKCGSTCAGHDPESVRKWISDVQIYFGKINSNPENREAVLSKDNSDKM